MRSRIAMALGVSVLVGASLAARAQPTERPRELTRAERRALIRGELVRRPLTSNRAGHRYLGGTSFIRVRAPRDEVFATALDTRLYPRLIPGVVEARLVEDHGDRRVVYLRHALSIVSVSYYVNVRIDRPAHTVHFALDPTRPHDVRAGRGYLAVSSYRRTDSIVTWAVMADPGHAIVSGIFGSVIRDWILKVPLCLRAQHEPDRQGC